jgi:1,4-alpha-glucan branching enzyme
MKKDKLIELFHGGSCIDAWQMFGAHKEAGGIRFTVYAPHARNVSVIGTFTGWNDHPLKLERTGFTGVWSGLSTKAIVQDKYKYRIEDSHGTFRDKADPYAFQAEYDGEHASIIYDLNKLKWHDQAWLNERTKNFDRPMNIYEVYAGGWKKDAGGRCSYRFLQNELIPYLKEKGFTHVEFMPLNEHPYDGSWGYQASGYYAVTSRYGSPQDFGMLVDELHRNGIGVIMDMVPVHFVKDEFGLKLFDGEPLYEYHYDYDAESPWGTLNFNLWKEEVRSFLMSACSFWCEIYHIDGLRIDAVSNMIYWDGDKRRGTNKGALAFLQRLNYAMHTRHPEVMMIAEDSTDYPHVTRAIEDGGVGFDYKWDLGWMNDTLNYYACDPAYRSFEHGKLLFSMAYYYSERFLLPLSHDENVHGKKSVVDRMWGDYDAKFAQVRNLYGYMFAHPGKKLNFMGNELAVFREFDEKRELDWMLLAYPKHQSFVTYFDTLCRLYREHPALYEKDYDDEGFVWLDDEDARECVFVFGRFSAKETIVCVMNMTEADYPEKEIPVSEEGVWHILLNSEESRFGGIMETDHTAYSAHVKDGRCYVTVHLAPYACLWLNRD